ncbi:hypothetical protein QYF61_018404 [Mycteria americana]|uniref:ribonuclease H n=1 Tax=Mycteria americana TaxID=33587 RepID=A0AAN7RTC3_MYCAM|nr:hypothetical protein QYF61_018404 [Mycteria americana]
MLSEDEASGYWGPVVFLNLGPDPTNTPHSITSRVAYWAGGIDTMERGEPSIIPIKSLSELSTAVTKAACIQAMHKRGSHDVPLSATVDFAMLKPLIRGAPAILKSHLVAKRDEIKKDTEHNEGLGDNAQTARKQLPTWADLMHGIVNYSREMGWDDAPAEKQNLKSRGGDHKRLPNSSVWSFGSNIDPNPSRNREAAVRALRAAPALPESKITNVPQYPLSAAARNGISEVIADLEKRQIISRTHSPYNSPVWPVRKPDGRWRLTVDYRRLNANTAPLTAAVPNIANLTATLQIAAHPWMAALDVKDMFFMVPLKEEDKEKFAFTWEGIQYTFNRLPQGYKHSPMIAHAALAELLQTVSLPQEVKLYQYIDDILIGGTSPEKVGEAAAAVWQALNKAEIEIPPGKCQGPSKEVKFLGTWWIAGSAVIPPDTLRKIEELQMPQSRKELQQLMGTLGYWRKHVPGFSIISRPLYSLLRKGKPWEWKLEHKEAVKTLTEELKTYQSLGPVHPRDPIIAEWGFAEHATYCNLFQTGPDGPKRPLLFSSTAFKETEQRYSEWEKGLLSLVRAVKQVEKIHQGQPVQTRGPFNLLEAILKGTAPPEGVAQKPTVRKWYAYLTGVAENMQLTEGHTKVSKLQVPINTDPLALQQPFKPSPILDAPPLTEGTPTENIWFTDASAKRCDAPEHLKYIDDIIVWGNKAEEVFEKGKREIQILLKAGFAMKKSKIKGPAQEIQFLGIKWQDGCCPVAMDVVNKIATTSPPANKKETQAFLGLVKQEIDRAVALGPVRIGPAVQNVLYTAAGEHGLTWSLWQKTSGETRGRPLGFWSWGYQRSEAHYTLTEKEILAAYEGVRATSEVVGTEAYLLLAPRLPVLHWMFKGNIPSTHHVTSTTWSKWVALITQQARVGKPNCPGILEEIMDWPEGRDFGALPEEVAHDREAPPYNELSEDERHYAVFTDRSCRVVGNHRKWKAAVWSPTRQVTEATEGQGESSQFAEVKAIQLA